MARHPAVRPGAHLGDIGATIQKFAESHGYSIVREFCGHGIGRQFHEEPQVLHYGRAGTGLKLQPGMIFTDRADGQRRSPAASAASRTAGRS